MRVKVCGPKLSLCGSVLSAWGVIQLTLMGLFFHFRSIAFIEDLKGLEDTERHHWDDPHLLIEGMERKFDNSAQNCFIAALLYLVTFAISAYQFWVNSQPVTSDYENFLDH